MSDRFYNSFDLERLPGGASATRPDHRSPFAVDRDRILFSESFRRLQSKTQVFQSGEYDFYRTRLTHSIEVAKICRSICGHLQWEHGADDPRGQIDADLTEAVGLAHDIGHPPFGHIGERKLNELMSPWGGFEGNAQSLRIITHFFYTGSGGRPRGIHPTRAFLDGILKYKQLWGERVSENRSAGKDQEPNLHPANHFLYDEQADVRTFVIGESQGMEAIPVDGGSHKSIECQIMDWADDTAYSLMDIVDGIHARYLTVERLDRWREQQGGHLVEAFDERAPAQLDALRKAILEERFEPKFSGKIGDFIEAVSLRPTQTANSNAGRTQRHAWDLEIRPHIATESRLYKQIAVDLIFRSPEIQQIEFKGSFILERIFDALLDNYLTGPGRSIRPLDILPASAARAVGEAETETAKARALCDFLAALTDGQAVRLYKRLFNPEYGSISDLL